MISPTVITSILLVLQTTTGSIEGVVVDSITSKPIAGAQVTLIRMAVPTGTTGGFAGGVLIAQPNAVVQGGTRPGMGQFEPATSDANGRFAFRNLEAGSYLLRGTADGYATQQLTPQISSEGSTTAQVTVAPGQAAGIAVLRFTPGGTVSGRVTGSNGEPLVNMEVSLLRNYYDPDGRKDLRPFGSAVTNDRGEYRLFWITPGRYYLSVAGANRPMPGVPFNPTAITNKYPRTFYPSTTNAAAAATAEIQPAGELTGMDFRLAQQPTYRVRGRVIDSITGQVPRNVSISIVPRDVVGGGVFSSVTPYNPADGTFELRDVPSGAHLIRSQMPLTARPDPGQPFPIPPIATTAVEISGTDVDGIVLNFVPPVSIRGRIRVEGESLAPEGTRLNLNLRPALAGPIAGPTRPPQWNPDGTFALDSVSPGEYFVQATGLPMGGRAPSMYVKEMRLGAMDLLTQPLVVSGPVSEEIIIVLAKDSAEISGTVQSDSKSKPSGIQVVAIPDQRARRDLYRAMGTDANGRFTFRNVPPGRYKIFAFEQIEPNSWRDPAVLRPFEDRGTPVSVGNSSSVTLELKSLPPANDR